MKFPLMLFIAIVITACAGERTEQQVSDEVEKVATDTTDRSMADGVHEYHDKHGNVIMRGQKINGKREGGWESFFPDGSLRSRGTFVNGLQEGASTVYYENGSTKYTGWYRNGMPVGDWKFYEEDGTPIKIVHYSEDGIKLEETDL